MSPPFRGKEHQDGLWAGLAAGSLQVVATDHAAFSTEQKAHGADRLSDDPERHRRAGGPAAGLWTRGVETGRLTPNEFVAATSTNIAKILNVYPKKGAIVEGADADVVVWDPKISKTISAHDPEVDHRLQRLRGHRGHGPGPLHAEPRRGDLGARQELPAPPGRGRFVPRPAFPAVNKALLEMEGADRAEGRAT